jgi:hypothetical protein
MFHPFFYLATPKLLFEQTISSSVFSTQQNKPKNRRLATSLLKQTRDRRKLSIRPDVSSRLDPTTTSPVTKKRNFPSCCEHRNRINFSAASGAHAANLVSAT